MLSVIIIMNFKNLAGPGIHEPGPNYDSISSPALKPK